MIWKLLRGTNTPLLFKYTFISFITSDIYSLHSAERSIAVNNLICLIITDFLYVSRKDTILNFSESSHVLLYYNELLLLQRKKLTKIS